MPSSMTELDVVNRALIKLGMNTITSLGNDSKSARTMTTIVNPVRDSFLRSCPWNPAVERATIASSTDVPAWGFTTIFPLPSDWLKILNVQSASSARPRGGNIPQQITYRIEDNAILCDEISTINIRYVKRLTDMTRYDSMMIEALATLYAVEACMSLTDDKGLKEQLKNEYRDQVNEAKTADGWDDAMYVFPTDPWLDVRF